jgi:glycosyltransferase involved in cell wall biosynthesis
MPEAENPQISVILLCYNHDKFVAEAVDGVLGQTYSPLDFVIIDDCSSDRTAEIITARLAERPDKPLVRFIRTPQNMQWRGACETALQVAKGRFIVLSCGDDIMHSDMVSEMADVWRRENVSLVTTNVDYIDEHSNSIGRTAHDCGIPADDSFETLARDGSNACCFGAAIGFERDIYSTFGLPPSHLEAFDIMLPYYAYLLKGARFISKPLLKYRVHGRNTSLSLTRERQDVEEQLITKARIFKCHLAHAVFMQEELDRLSVTMPTRHAELASTISPLLTVQTVEMAKKLVKTQIELYEIGR